MKDATRLLVNLHHVTEDGLDVAGELPAAVFALPEDGRLDCPQPLSYRLHLSLVGSGLLVEGEVRSQFRCCCDRCLKWYDLPSTGPVAHLLTTLPEDFVDLTEEVREDLLITLPAKFLCAEDCRGLCPQCGRDLNQGACSCQPQPPAAGTWAALDQLQL